MRSIGYLGRAAGCLAHSVDELLMNFYTALQGANRKLAGIGKLAEPNSTLL